MKINYKILGIFLFGILFMGTSAALITSSYGLNDLSEDLEHQDFSDGYLNQDEDEEENGSEDDSPEDEDEDNSDDNPDDGEEEDTEDDRIRRIKPCIFS